MDHRGSATPKGERKPSKSEQPRATKSRRLSIRCSLLASTTELICRSAIAPYASSPAWYKFIAVVKTKSRRRTTRAAATYGGVEHRQRSSPSSERTERAAERAKPATRKVATTSSRKTKQVLEEPPPTGADDDDVNATPTSKKTSKANTPGSSSPRTTVAATTCAARCYRQCSRRSRSAAFGIRGVAKTAMCGGKRSDSFERSSRRRGRKRESSRLLRTSSTSVSERVDKDRPSSCRRQRASTSTATTVAMPSGVSGEALNAARTSSSTSAAATGRGTRQRRLVVNCCSPVTAWSPNDEKRGWRGRTGTAASEVGNSIAEASEMPECHQCVAKRKKALNEAKLGRLRRLG